MGFGGQSNRLGAANKRPFISQPLRRAPPRPAHLRLRLSSGVSSPVSCFTDVAIAATPPLPIISLRPPVRGACVCVCRRHSSVLGVKEGVYSNFECEDMGLFRCCFVRAGAGAIRGGCPIWSEGAPRRAGPGDIRTHIHLYKCSSARARRMALCLRCC